EYHELIGAAWDLGATGHGAVHTFEVAPANRAHPITRGLRPFSTRDELWHRVAIQPTARVLCTAFSAEDRDGTGQDEPVAVVTRLGRGRCFNLILGHDVRAMASSGWRLLMLRGSEWAATGRVTITVPIDIDLALDAAAEYEHYQSRAPLVAVERLVQQAAADHPLRRELAPKMLDALASDATDDCKAFLLEQLSLIAGPREVPAIAELVRHETLGTAALAALERIPGEASAAALRKALPALEGAALVGAINVLGERRDGKGIRAISAYTGAEDRVVWEAAFDALGKIGTPAALKALRRSMGSATLGQVTALLDALLACADRLARAGHTRPARGTYAALTVAGEADHIRAAAFFGLVACSPGQRGALLIDACRGPDAALNAAASRAVRIVANAELVEAIAAELSTFRPVVQVQIINALADAAQPGAEPHVAAALSSGDPAVRLAAVRALGQFGASEGSSALLAELRREPPEEERPEIEQALGRAIPRAVAEGLVFAPDLSAEPPAVRASLLRVLGMAGDSDSLAILRKSLSDASSDIRLGAIGALSQWPDATPMKDLLQAARSSGEPAEVALAVTGMASLAPKALDTPEATTQLLADAMSLAKGEDEKRAILKSLGLIHHAGALQLAAGALDDESVLREACLAAVQVAQNLPDSHKAEIQPVMERVLAVGKSERVRRLAKTVLLDLGVPIDVTQTIQLRNPGDNLALGATATSPDGLDKDGAASGDQAAIDGNPDTYWDEVDNRALYRLKVTFPEPRLVSAIRITGYRHHAYAPRDFEVLCDEKLVKTVEEAWYEGNRFAVTFPATQCTSLELKITGYYGASPAIRELEVFNPPAAR
ncbi:MAG: HEAT repeat domain-containing protein, partial [Armatimonadota bacterium]